MIITWAMGLTQQKNAVATLKELITLLLLRGNIGKPGAGASPIRGHSNVQGDRTMGIWEQMSDRFLDALQHEFGFDPPREHGADALQTVTGLQRGDIRVFFAMGGNFVAAISDTAAAEAAMRGTELTVQVSTKLNRSHVVTGAEALILPTLGRTEVDLQASGPQFLSVEDSVCAVHATHGKVPPVAPGLLSEVAIVCRLAQATLGPVARDRLGRLRGRLRPHPRPHPTGRPGLRELQRGCAPQGRVRAAERSARRAALRHGDRQGHDHGERAGAAGAPGGPADPADACARTTSSTRRSTA